MQLLIRTMLSHATSLWVVSKTTIALHRYRGLESSMYA